MHIINKSIFFKGFKRSKPVITRSAIQLEWKASYFLCKRRYQLGKPLALVGRYLVQRSEPVLQ